MARAYISITMFLLVVQAVLSIAAFWIPWAIPVALVTTAILTNVIVLVIGVLGAEMEKVGML